MSKAFTSILLALLLSLRLYAQGREVLASHDDRIHVLLERLRDYGKHVPQEKVFIHMDNTSYCLGDTLWFAAYLRQTDNQMPSEVSGILYVELLNQDGYLMERKLIDIEHGKGHGQFVLKKDYMWGGYYELRAYTRWQLNWGVHERKHSRVSAQWFINKDKEREFYRDYDKLYSRVFPVYDAPKENGPLEHNMTTRVMRRYYRESPDSKHEINVSLYPEGGSLTEGLKCRMAFEASADDGEWVDGTLILGEDSALTVNRGRGCLDFIPSSHTLGTAIFCTKEGERVKVNMPEIQETGVALAVCKEGKTWRADVTLGKGLDPALFAMTVMHEGLLQYYATLDTVRYTFCIPDSILPVGIQQITVFDTCGHVWADRLVFETKPELYQPSLLVDGMALEYQPCERINLRVRSCNRDAGAVISLAVRDAYNQDWTYDSGNIMTEMLLSSEVKGFIPQPEWYFSKDDPEHRQGLDLLMMTQGWRRFVWRDMAVKGEWGTTEPAEKNMIVSGRVTKPIRYVIDDESEVSRDNSSGDGRLKRGVAIHAELILKDELEIAEASTNRDGLFRLRVPKFYGKTIFFIAASDSTKWRKGQRYNWVQIKDELSDQMLSILPNRRLVDLDPEALRVTLSFPYPRFVKPYNHYQTRLADPPLAVTGYEGADSGARMLKPVFVRARRNGLRGFDPSSPVFMIDAYEAYNNAYDAGFINTSFYGIARSFVSDMGLDFPFVQKFQESLGGSSGIKSKRVSNIRLRYGVHPERLADFGIPVDSVYHPKYLLSFAEEDVTGERGNRMLNFGQLRDYEFSSKVDRYIIYTDYSPRLEGNERYRGSDLPEVNITKCLFPDGGSRYFYRDRRLILPGLSEPAVFYHPDYSRQSVPEQKDYRRTLYWNPCIVLNEEGEADVTFYNNSNHTRLSFSVEGMTPQGGLLTVDAYP